MSKTLYIGILLILWTLGAGAPLPMAMGKEIDFTLPVKSVRSGQVRGAELTSLQKKLGLVLGKPINQNRLDREIRAMKQRGEIQSLFVEASQSNGGLDVSIRVSRLTKVRNIKFENVDTEVLEEIRTEGVIKSGDLTDVSVLNQLKSKIEQAYAERGYNRAEVQVLVAKVPGSRESDVSVKVNAREQTIVGTIKIVGANEDETEEMTGRLSLKEGKPFSKPLLNDSIEAINRYLRSNQFLTSKVEQSALKFSEDQKQVDITIFVKLEQSFQFEFQGNTVFSEVQLRDLMTEEVLSQVNTSQTIANRIEEKYRSVGFHFCKVGIEDIFNKVENINVVRFTITEGNRVLIKSIEFSGEMDVVGPNGPLSRNQIKKMFFEQAPGVLKRKVFWETGLKRAVQLMKRRLITLGYLKVRISVQRVIFNDRQDRATILVNMNLGNRSIVSGVQFSGNSEIAPQELQQLFGVRKGDPYNEAKAEQGKEAVANYYKRLGYSDVEISQESKREENSVSLNQEDIFVTLKVSEGEQYRVGEVSVEGANKTKPKVILREMRLNSGDVYNPELIQESEEAISLLGLFSRVEILSKQNASNENQKDLKIVVRETKPGLGEVGLGGIYEDPRFRLRSFLGVGYRNVYGLNQTASFRGELLLPFAKDKFVDFVEYSAILGYRAPYPIDIPLVFSTQLSFDNFLIAIDPDTFQNRARIEGKLEKRISKSFLATYRLYSLERTVTEKKGISRNEEIIGSTGPGVILDFRNDPFNPTRGSYHTMDVEFAHPFLLSNSEIGFVMAIQRNSAYVPLFHPFSLHTYAGFGYAHSIIRNASGFTPLPEARLTNDLSLGGRGSIRGFKVRQFSPGKTTVQTAFYNFRAELWTSITRKFSTVLLFDTGQIFPGLKPTERHDGLGVGLGYETPVGPIAVDIAVGLEKGAQGRFYFTVGTI